MMRQNTGSPPLTCLGLTKHYTRAAYLEILFRRLKSQLQTSVFQDIQMLPPPLRYIPM